MFLNVFRDVQPVLGLSGSRFRSAEALMSGVKIRENLSGESLQDNDPFTFHYDVTVDGEVMSGGPVRLDRWRQEPHVTRESVTDCGDKRMVLRVSLRDSEELLELETGTRA